MTLPTNAKNRPFSWSLSALQDFEGCPFRYAARRFYYSVEFVSNEFSIWGDRVHKAAELVLQGEKCSDAEAFKPVAPYVEVMLASGLPMDVERQIVLDENLKPLDGEKAWFSKKAWLRLKADVILYDNLSAKYADFKTGKIKEDDDQHLLTFAALSVVRPDLVEFEGRYIWLKHKQVSNPICRTKKDIPDIWAYFIPRVEKMVRAWREESFPQRPSGLCGWCPVVNCPKRR